ncbi:MAG: heparan-alpha-glucosaminide N-acetyltransferase domain-containing protein [Pirellulaceae bacterium]|nr:heparan-alpha-glucosaminide N-acetyltransferase domain-containing protein [Pirellulaceae bacterium]
MITGTENSRPEKPVMLEPQAQSNRLFALDIFRGMTIFFMIVVNTPGSWNHVYAPLLHAKWNGLTPTDLVFPFFVYIVGCAMAFSFTKFDRSLNYGPWYIKVLRRTFLIFAIGIVLNWFPFYDRNFAELRVYGVLQRIALAYGLAALIIMHCPKKWLPLAGSLLLIGYFGLLMVFGGESPLTLEANAVRKLDLWLVGAGHVYHGYGMPFDPEGLLSTIPTVVTVLFGYWVGLAIQRPELVLDKIKAVLPFALFTTLLGIALNYLGCPINKPIWSSSYVLVTGGLATFSLSALIYVLDYKKWRGWSIVFEAFGKNPLFCYVAAALIAKSISLVRLNGVGLYEWAYGNIFQPWFGYYTGSCVQALTFTMLIWILAWLLYRKDIVIKI